MIIPRKIKWGFLIATCIIWQVLFMHPCFSQDQHKMDSLLAKLKTAKEDTNKVKILHSLSNCLFNNEPHKSFDYAEQEFALSKKLNFKRGIIHSYHNIGGFYFNMTNIDSTLYYTNKALPIIKQINDKQDLVDYYQTLAGISLCKTDYVTALDLSNKGLQIATEIKDSNLIAFSLEVKGEIYTYMANYPTAFNYLLEAAKIGLSINNKDLLSNSYCFIGDIFWLENNDDKKAVYYYQLSLKDAREAYDKFHIASSLQQLGEMSKNNKQWDKALDYFQQALSINTELGNVLLISSCTRSLALIYSDSGKYDKAISLMNKVFSLLTQNNNKIELCAAYENMGEIYLKGKDYPTAIVYLNKSLDLAKATKQKNNESCTLDDLAKCYEGLKNYKSAYSYLSMYSDVNDSIINDETVKNTVALEATYNSDKKDKEIALLTKDKKIQELEAKKHTSLEYSLMAGLVLLCILFFFVYRNYGIRQKLLLQQLRNKIALDLHDEVGSSLSSIKIFSEIARRNSKELTPTFDRIIDYSQETIESIADIVWTINPENDNVEKIIVRMRSFAYEILGAKNIYFEFNADESLDKLKLSMDERKNLYLIFKEAVNNMIKHSEANRAVFSISKINNELKMLIVDNGKGFDIKKQSQGNGLNNMKKRAVEIGADFFIASELGNGTTIHLLIKTAA